MLNMKKSTETVGIIGFTVLFFLPKRKNAELKFC